MIVSSQVLEALRISAGRPPTFVESCHEPQRAFVMDRSRQKAALCGRRAGKSYGVAAWLLDGALRNPGRQSLYVTLSQGESYRILWPALRHFGDRLGLRERTVKGMLMGVLPNGHSIWMAGAPHAREGQKFRGVPFVRVVVDEAQSFERYLQALVEQDLRAALTDFGGEICLSGTPDSVASGFFHDVTEGGNPDVRTWPTHRWTMLENPFLPSAAAEMVAMREFNGWDADHPTYRREWLGQWVSDAGQLVYPLDEARNSFPGKLPDDPPGRWRTSQGEPSRFHFRLGVDIGWSAGSALVVVALRVPQMVLYVLEAHVEAGLNPLQLADRIKAVQARYKVPVEEGGLGTHLPVVVDEGALGAGYADLMRQSGVGCTAAEKTGKRAAQDFLRGRILSGKVLVDYRRCRALVEEASRLAFGEDQREDKRTPNHACDGLLYAARSLMPGLGRDPAPPPPPIGSAEWQLAEVEAHKEGLFRRLEESRKARR